MKVLIAILIMKIWILKYTAHQSHEKWQILYPFLFFSSSKNEWLCTICSDYEEGNKFWRTKGVEQDEHPNHKFPTHEKSKKYTKAVLKCAEMTHIFSKEKVYKLTKERRHKTRK